MKIMSKTTGRFAELREKFLMENALELYNEMVNEGYLEEHLENVQDFVSEYIDKRVETMKQGEAYRKAEMSGNLSAVRSLIETEQLFAEDEAKREWVYSLPLSDNNEEE